MSQLYKARHHWVLSLSEPEQITLQEGLRHHPSPQVRERRAALLAVGQGHSPHWAARQALLVPRDPNTVYHWLAWYRQEELMSILAHRHEGAKRGLFEQAQTIRERLRFPQQPQSVRCPLLVGAVSASEPPLPA